jgi:hypothetical protein
MFHLYQRAGRVRNYGDSYLIYLEATAKLTVTITTQLRDNCAISNRLPI